MSETRPHTIFVSGLSGSGKTTVMAALEDLGFYCADNLPVQLVGQFLDLCAKASPPLVRIAMAIDAREGPLVAQLPATLRALRDTGGNVELLFLEAGVRELMNRYRETRRVHPTFQIVPYLPFKVHFPACVFKIIFVKVDGPVLLRRPAVIELLAGPVVPLHGAGWRVHRHALQTIRPAIPHPGSRKIRAEIPGAHEILCRYI